MVVLVFKHSSEFVTNYWSWSKFGWKLDGRRLAFGRSKFIDRQPQSEIVIHRFGGFGGLAGLRHRQVMPS